ncbi:MAG: helix-turn-helix domain-containing protein [Hyphomicrobiaceae bacterium]|nr:helix-turn-helix domain-containing protein [Hyphomicrobiaceae bacterium]
MLAADDIELLAGVTSDTRKRLLARAELEIVASGTLIVEEGDQLQKLHIIRKGVVELSANVAGNRATIALLGHGDSFILAAVVTNGPALMTARPMGNAEIVHIPAELFRRCMRRDPGLLINASHELGRGFRRMVRHLRDQKLRSTNQRLAAYLVRLHREQNEDGLVHLTLRKHVVASLLGMQPASLSRAFAELQDLGVKVKGDVVRIADPEVLQRYAGMASEIDDWDT